MEGTAMKKLFLIPFLVFAFFSLEVKASELTLRIYDNSTFDVVINGRHFYKAPGSITLSHVRPGSNHIRVFKYRMMPSGALHPRPRVVFDGHVNIRPGRAVYALIDRHGRFIIEREYALSAPPYHTPPVYAPPYMSDHDFIHLKGTLQRMSFDSSRLRAAKQAIAVNTVTAVQVRQLMTLFSFESNRLELAKFAYHYTYDKHRYFIVNDAFTFSSSIRSLDRYIAGF